MKKWILVLFVMLSAPTMMAQDISQIPDSIYENPDMQMAAIIEGINQSRDEVLAQGVFKSWDAYQKDNDIILDIVFVDDIDLRRMDGTTKHRLQEELLGTLSREMKETLNPVERQMLKDRKSKFKINLYDRYRTKLAVEIGPKEF